MLYNNFYRGLIVNIYSNKTWVHPCGELLNSPQVLAAIKVPYMISKKETKLKKK